ncbi:MAG: tetratricopeptide repeat protein, partial [Lentisphaerota bacterium]
GKGKAVFFQRTFRFIARLSLLLIFLLINGCTTRRVENDFYSKLRLHPDRGACIRRFPLFPVSGPQGEYSAYAGTFQYWRVKTSPDIIEKTAAVSATRQESFEYCIEKMAVAHGLWMYASPIPMDALKKRLQQGIPVIVPLQEAPLDPASRHFVVVTGYDDVDQTLLVNNMMPAQAVWKYPDFLKKWSVQRFSATTLSPPTLADRPLNEDERLSRARFYEATRRYDEAINDYQLVLAANSRSSLAYTGLGNVCRDQNKTDQAEKMYRKALAANPMDGKAYNNLAYLLAEDSRHLDEAVALARQAVILDAGNPMTLDTLGYALLQQGKLGEAASVLERARSKAKSYPLNIRTAIGLHLAWTHYKAEQWHLAIEVLKDIQRQDPQAVIPEPLKGLLK